MKSKIDHPVALITGSARRIGAVIASTLHQAGFRVVIHYHQSESQAQALAASLNQQREHSAIALHADLNHHQELSALIENVHNVWQRLDVLVNNASTFFPTTCGTTTVADWDNLMNTNLKAPYFLAQAATQYLAAAHGSIINIADIHGQRALKGYTVYSTAKAGLMMLTQALARELAPDIRVNAIAPGITLLPEKKCLDEKTIEKFRQKTALKRFATPQDIANAVLFFIQQTSITGQTLNIDCGRSLRQ